MCLVFQRKIQLFWILYISGWLTVPVNPDIYIYIYLRILNLAATIKRWPFATPCVLFPQQLRQQWALGSWFAIRSTCSSRNVSNVYIIPCSKRRRSQLLQLHCSVCSFWNWTCPVTRYNSICPQHLASSATLKYKISEFNDTHSASCVTSGFRYGVINACTLLGLYAARNGTFLSTFQDKLSVPTSEFKHCNLNFEDGTDRLPPNLGDKLPFCAA